MPPCWPPATDPCAKTVKAGRTRGVFCGMGVCYDCLVTIDGTPNRRACMTPVEDHMEIQINE